METKVSIVERIISGGTNLDNSYIWISNDSTLYILTDEELWYSTEFNPDKNIFTLDVLTHIFNKGAEYKNDDGYILFINKFDSKIGLSFTIPMLKKEYFTEFNHQGSMTNSDLLAMYKTLYHKSKLQNDIINYLP